MSFLKRGWLSVKRKPGKTLLLFLIVFILSNVIAGAISITQAAKSVEKSIKLKMGAVCTIAPDHEKLDKWYEENSDKDFDNPIKPVTVDLVETIAQSPYLKFYDYNQHASIGQSQSFKIFKPESPDSEDDKLGKDPWNEIFGFNLLGVQYHKISLVETGKIRLIEGDVFTPDNIKNGDSVCLIPKELANLNNVKVGDTIDPTAYIIDDEKTFGEEKKKGSRDGEIEFVFKHTQAQALKVIGIFENVKQKPKENSNKRRDNIDEFFDAQRKGNMIIVPNKIVTQINRFNFENFDHKGREDMNFDDTQWIEPKFYLKDPNDIEAFVEETNPLLPQFMKTVTSVDNYKNIAAPVEKTSKLANIVLWVALVATILIVTLVILLFLRDRKHELGIYLSLGEGRGKVIGQILTEVLIIGVIAITLSLFTGHFLAKNLSGGIIEKNAQEKPVDDMYYYRIDEVGEEVTSEDVLNAYEVKLSGGYVALFYLVGLATLIVATLIPMLYIVRLNPKKIMM